MKSKVRNKRLAILFLSCLVWGACGTAENESNKAEDLYNKFLNGELCVGDMDIYYYITPTGEPDKRYTTDYIIIDSTGDGIPELHLRTAREYTVFSCVDDELVIIQSFFSSPWLYNVTKNGAFIYREDTGTTIGDFYRYFEMDSSGNLINEVTFEWTDINKNLICDENDEFIYDNRSCTKEEWDQQTKEYLFTDEEGRYQIHDQAEWIRFCQTDYPAVREEQKESEAPVEESEWVEDTDDDAAAVCAMMRAMDFTVEQPHMELTEEEDRAYKEAFLRLLKNELPIEGWEVEYYQDLWKAGIPYGDLLEERDNVDYPYAYYYDDIDGDGKPEFGLEQGCAFFFDYELGEDACSISYDAESQYFKKLLGVGRIWEQDGMHAGVERNRYIVLNSDGEWETVIELSYYSGGEQNYYDINNVDVGKENWEELTAPFFEATEHEVQAKTLREVFGELLDEDWPGSVETRKEVFRLYREKVDEDVPYFYVYVEFPQLESTLYPAAIEQANANLRDSAFGIFGDSYEEAVAQLTELEQDLSVYEWISIDYDILQVTEDEFHILFVVEKPNGNVPEYEEYQITINLKTGEFQGQIP